MKLPYHFEKAEEHRQAYLYNKWLSRCMTYDEEARKNFLTVAAHHFVQLNQFYRLYRSTFRNKHTELNAKGKRFLKRSLKNI